MKFPQPTGVAITEILDKIKDKPKEVAALHNLLVSKNDYGQFTYSAEYAAMALINEGYKISPSTVRTYRRTAVNNPFTKESKS